MALKRTQLTSRITDNLIAFSTSAHAKSVIGLYDDARGAQEFFKGLFNIVFGYSLVDLDKLHDVTNYKAIDLGDETEKIAIQITLQTDSFKINQTIKKFNEAELYKTYDRLVIYVIGNKLNYRSKFDTKGEFAFDPDKDIWDDNHLVKQIDKIEDISKLEQLDEYLSSNLDTYINTDHLFDQDIKDCILSLKANLGKILIESSSSRVIPIRNDDYIKDKNKLNNLSWDFFENNIQSHISYNTTIEDFLKNPINKNLLDDYLQVTESIHEFYLSNQDKYSSFELVFKDIFNMVPRSYDNHIDELKIKILLHNMYFYCDIGVNPVYAKA